ncbi:hypothetical protein ACFVQB_14350 [Paenibacillus sp. NPDC057886]|uniref:hypothetical protein n=1 Tax=Paenibacillus sp. NPDC057886 TaxID=3346270 RepID=UPI0036C6713B
MNQSMSEEEKQYWINYYEENKTNKAEARKSVVDVNPETMWEYEYQAKHFNGIIIASDSLNNLKKEVKNRKWLYADITCTNGSFSYGQRVVDEYHYEPRYR